MVICINEGEVFSLGTSYARFSRRRETLIFLRVKMNAMVLFCILLHQFCSAVCASIIDDLKFPITVGLRDDTVNASGQLFFFVVGANYDAYFHLSYCCWLVSVYPNSAEGKEEVLFFVEEITPQSLKHGFFHGGV